MHSFMHEVMHKYTLGLCVHLQYTYSLGKEFFYHEEQDLTATPVGKQIESEKRAN